MHERRSPVCSLQSSGARCWELVYRGALSRVKLILSILVHQKFGYSMRRHDLNLLATLDVLLTEGSVSKAAHRLNLSQPAVSASLARLRKLFADPLLIRGARGMQLTPRAQQLLPDLNRMLEEIGALVEPKGAFDPVAAHLTFTLSAFDYLQHGLVAPLVNLLRKEAPNICFALHQLESGDVGRQLQTGDLDLCITTTLRSTPRLIVQPLYIEQMVAVLRKGHPQARERLTLKRFCAMHHAVLHPSRMTEKTDETLGSRGKTRRIGMILPNYHTILDAVCSSDMLAMMPFRLARRYVDRVAIRSLPFTLEKFTIAALWHPRTHLSPAHQWLRSRVIEITTAKQRAR